MTAEQLIAVNGKNNVLEFHMKMWRGDNEEDVGKKYASLGKNGMIFIQVFQPRSTQESSQLKK